MQKHVNLVDLVKSFPTNIFLQNFLSIFCILLVFSFLLVFLFVFLPTSFTKFGVDTEENEPSKV